MIECFHLLPQVFYHKREAIKKRSTQFLIHKHLIFYVRLGLKTIFFYGRPMTLGISTKFAGSSCNDLVTVDGVQILSGHFDKRYNNKCDSFNLIFTTAKSALSMFD